MQYRELGKTGLKLPVVGFGASSLGQEFRKVDVSEAMQAVRVALDEGMNFIDTAPFYGRGMSEVLLGILFREIPRDSYILQTKLGRYDANHFDFSAKRVRESVDVSLHRLGTDHIDIMICHDIEFVDVQQVIDETIPALREVQKSGKVRFIGVSGYPLKNFTTVLKQTPLDVVLSYNHYTLQNTSFGDLVPFLKERGVGIENAAPFAARLLCNDPLPVWHKATPKVREVAAQAAAYCREHGSDLAKLALQFSIRNEEMTTCIAGTANPARVSEWCRWAEEPIDEELLQEVLKILNPIHNWAHVEGKPENNEPAGSRFQNGEFVI